MRAAQTRASLRADGAWSGVTVLAICHRIVPRPAPEAVTMRSACFLLQGLGPARLQLKYAQL